MHRLLLLLLLIINSSNVIAQIDEPLYSVENFFLNEGLPVIRIYDISQDHKGLIWLCTESGLFSFNGSDFEMHIDFGQVNYFPNKILFDNNDKLWLFNHQTPSVTHRFGKILGLKIFDKNFEELTKENYINDQSFPTNKIIQNEDGVLFFQVKEKIYRFDKSLEEIKLPIPSNSFLFQNEDVTVVNDSTDVIILDTKSYEILHRVKNETVEYIDRYKNKLLLHFISRNFICYDLKNKEAKSEVLDQIGKFHKEKIIDQDGIVWSISLNSLLKYNLNNSESVAITDQSYFKPTSYLTSIFADKEKNIWVGSNQGLYKISKINNDFFNLTHQLNKSTRAILELNKDELFVSTYDGDLISNYKNKTTKNLSSGEIKFSAQKIGDYYYTISENNVLRKIKISNHEVVLQKTIPIGKDSYVYPPLLVKDLSNGFILKSSHKIYSIDKNLNYELLHEDQDVGLVNLQISKDNIYLSTTKGLKIYDHSFNLKEQYLSSFFIKHVHQDKEQPNIHWITSSSFLIKLNLKTGKQEVFDTNHGFINSNFTDIKEYDGELWLPSFTGLYRFNKKTREVKAFLQEDGIANNEFNNYSSTVLENGMYVFGGVSGITILDPSQKEIENIDVPYIEIFECSKYNSFKEVDITEQVERSRKVVIDESDVLLNMSFAHYSYNKLKSKVFRYRILSSSKKDTIVPWVKINSNQVQIGRIPYGKYNLEIQAISRSGNSLSDINKIELDYVRPFMKTNFFKVFSLLFLICFVYFIIHVRSLSLTQQKIALEKEVNLRTIQIQKQKEQLEAINSTKDKLFSILAHDLKSPLITLKNISGKINYLIKKNQPDRILEIGKTLENKVSNLSIFLDNILNWSLQQRGHFTYNPEFIQLDKLTEEILNIYEDQIQEKNLLFSLSIPEDSKCFADKSSIHAVLRNLINNSIKYSPENEEINLSFETGNQYNIYSIEDNGKGIEKKVINSLFNNEKIQSKKGTKGEAGTGLGLLISKELIELNKGHIKFLTNFNKGTTVQVYLPRN